MSGQDNLAHTRHTEFGHLSLLLLAEQLIQTALFPGINIRVYSMTTILSLLIRYNISEYF